MAGVVLGLGFKVVSVPAFVPALLVLAQSDLLFQGAVMLLRLGVRATKSSALLIYPIKYPKYNETSTKNRYSIANIKKMMPVLSLYHNS